MTADPIKTLLARLLCAASSLMAASFPAQSADPVVPPKPLSVSPGTPASAPRLSPSPPARPVRKAASSEPSCPEAQRRYAESQACFAPYRLANGGIDAEAFRHCQAVKDPSPRCGLPDLKPDGTSR